MKQGRPSAAENGEKTMNKIVKILTVTGMACLLAGCETTGMSPREAAGIDYPSYIATLPPATNQPPKMSVPVHLAVAQVGEIAPPDVMLAVLSTNKNLVASVCSLSLPGGQSLNTPDYYPYNRQSAPQVDYTGNMQALLRQARASGADYLFLFGGNLDSVREQTPLVVFDITLVGGFILPGSEIRMEGKSAGTLIDVNSGAPVAFTSAEIRDSQLTPDEFADDATINLRAKVRDRLIAKLSGELLEKISALNSNNSNH
jgi:hypothetical protein